jgi:ankyrin repeat protein
VHHPKLLGLLGLPAGAPAGQVRAALNKKNGDGDLPIHRALFDAATGPELVRAMLDAGGEAMLGVPGGDSEQLPLHVAAWLSPSPAVVALLLARGPAGALRAKEGLGRTPLALAETGNRGPAAAEIKALLRATMQ